MKIHKWTTIDVHYTESEQEQADKERKRLERLGYEYQQSDASGSKENDFCDQYIKINF